MKECKKCNKTYKLESFKYCPICGNILHKLGSISSYGLWKVSTKVRMMENTFVPLGTFQGHIDDIALYVVSSCCGYLVFSRQEIIEETYLDNDTEVDIRLDSSTCKISDMYPGDRADYFRQILKDRKVDVECSDHPGCVKIKRPRGYEQ